MRGKERGHWKRPVEFILSLVGFSIGLGAIWRFPYLAMRNGGGAFLIPYILFVIVVGIPVIFMETAFGQYFQLSPLLIFEACPLFKGLGISVTTVGYVNFVYYMAILAWTLYYLAMCFKPILPWTTCDNPWNTNSCVPILSEINSNVTNVSALATESSNASGHLATEEFWQYSVLDISSGIDDPGQIRWQLLIPLIIAFALIYICVFKGIESSRIAVYITATAPFVFLVLFLIWHLTRPGSSNGLLFYVTPRWEKVMRFQTWLEAFFQVFYSLGLGWGPLINLSSYNTFHHNCLRDSLVIALLDTITVILCGAVVFAGVGCISYQAGVPLTDVITTGPGLSFVTYPQVVTLFPVPHFWAVCFFLLLLFLGMDSLFAQVKTLTTGLTDLYPEKLAKKEPLLMLIVILGSLLLSLPFITRGGMYAFHIVDWYATFFTVLLVVLCESIVIGWVYGVDRFLGNIREMGFFCPPSVNAFMKICWKFSVPFCVLTALIVAMVKFRSPSYGDYTYPDWTNAFGWLMALSSSIPIPAVMVYTLVKTQGTIMERLKSLIRPRIGKMGRKIGEDNDTEKKSEFRGSMEEHAML